MYDKRRKATLSRAFMLFVTQHEGSDCADRADGEALQRSHSQLPYFLGRPAQDHAVIKSGYCVKQGAVVSSCTCSMLGSLHSSNVGKNIFHLTKTLVFFFVKSCIQWRLGFTLALLFSDEELEEAIFLAGRKRDELLQIRFGNYISRIIRDVRPECACGYSLSPYCQGVKANTLFLLLLLTLVVCCLWNSVPSLYMSHHAMFSPLCFLSARPQAFSNDADHCHTDV